MYQILPCKQPNKSSNILVSIRMSETTGNSSQKIKLTQNETIQHQSLMGLGLSAYHVKVYLRWSSGITE